MSIHYLVSIKQQLYNFVSNTTTIKYPFIVASDASICSTKQSFLDIIKSSDPNNGALIAFKLLPIYNFLPNVIIYEVISLLTPQDRIELSHTCNYFRSLIISPRCLSDLWLYIYHIPIQKVSNSSKTSDSNAKSSTFLPYMIFNTNTATNNTTNNPSPSHATSLPNTLATSTAMSSRQPSIKSLFKASSSTSSHSESPPSISPINNRKKKIDENMTISNLAINHLKYSQESKYNDDNDNDNKNEDDEYKNDENQNYSQIALSRSPNTSSLCDCNGTTLDKDNISDSTISSTNPLLEHPSNPVLTSKIIYWPNYKEVLSCDFPLHWRRKNSFYPNLCILSKHCGGAHIRVFEVGTDRLSQILSRISPILLSLCFLNIHQINLDSYAFRCMTRLSYLAYQFIDGQCTLHIPQNIVALEFTSCSFNTPCFLSTSSVLSNIKFLQICNCRFLNYSFQRLLNLCPNVVHISITTSSWDDTISLQSSLLSIIWKHNEGDFTISHCNKVWEVALTIYDSEMIEELQNISSLKQLVIATPLFKGMDFLNDMDKPWSFNTHQTTPYYNAKSPSVRSISHISLSPSLPALSHRLNNNGSSRLQSPIQPSLNKTNASCSELELSSIQYVQPSISNMSISTISLDSDDDDDDDNDDNHNSIHNDKDDDILRIVCYEELLNKQWFTKQFIGEHIKFMGQRIINPIIQDQFNKLNPIFVSEMKRTTHMFLISFPFF